VKETVNGCQNVGILLLKIEKVKSRRIKGKEQENCIQNVRILLLKAEKVKQRRAEGKEQENCKWLSKCWDSFDKN